MAKAHSVVLDTNYIVRLVVRDVPEQTDLVVALVSDAAPRSLIVSDAVFCETLYVLEKVYQYKRQVIAKALGFVLDQPAFDISSDFLSLVLERYVTHPKLSCVDCYAWVHATTTQRQLLSFDKDLNKAMTKAQK